METIGPIDLVDKLAKRLFSYGSRVGIWPMGWGVDARFFVPGWFVWYRGSTASRAWFTPGQWLLYWSPNGTPWHHAARGLGVEPQLCVCSECRAARQDRLRTHAY